MLKIHIHNEDVSKIVSDGKLLIKTVGILAPKIIQRLNELEAANNFYEFKEFAYGKPHPLNNIFDQDCYSVHLDKVNRLIIKPVTDDYSNKGLMECKEVIVKGVVDYHGGKQNWKIP